MPFVEAQQAQVLMSSCERLISTGRRTVTGEDELAQLGQVFNALKLCDRQRTQLALVMAWPVLLIPSPAPTSLHSSCSSNGFKARIHDFRRMERKIPSLGGTIRSHGRPR
jgi:hypothetical protein